MRKGAVILFSLFLALFIASCGPDPTKAMQDAKTAIDRAKSVDAPIYASDDFTGAEKDYSDAENLVKTDKKEDAIKKANDSKLKADTSYDKARQKRTDEIYTKDVNLMALAEQNFASKLMAEKYAAAVKDFDAFSNLYAATNYDQAYPAGVALFSNLTEIVNTVTAEVDKVKQTIAAVQDKYDAANNNADYQKYAKAELSKAARALDEARAMLGQGDLTTAVSKAKEAEDILNGIGSKAESEKAKDMVATARDKYESASKKDIVIKYAMEDLKKALPLIDDAKTALDGTNYPVAISKSQDAINIIDEAVRKAEAEYQKVQSQNTNTIDLNKQKETEEQKKKANDYIEEAKKRLEMLKKQKGGSFQQTINGDVAFALPGFFHVSDQVGKDDTNATTTNKGSSDEAVTTDMVEKYIQLAEDAYSKEEYLDAMDYAREAIRLADILIAEGEYGKYVVKYKPEDRDCLWKIAGYMYGGSKTWLWPIIWRANKYIIKDPDLIFPGQEFKIPPSLVK